MTGWKRVLGLPRAFAPGAAACVVWGATACSTGSDSPHPTDLGFGGALSTGGAPQAGFSGVAGSAGSGAGAPSSLPVPPCVQPLVSAPVFADQLFDRGAPAPRELFSWTTPEQAAAIRKDQQLFTLEEAQGLGSGFAFTYLAQLAQTAPEPTQQQLAGLLSGELFAKKRYAWPEPWATRMGWPGEDYGNQLLRVVLKAEAWVVVVAQGRLQVFDLENRAVAVADAIASPSRIGAIFYVKDAVVGGPTCGGSFLDGGNGYREFILGNLDMVEEWSIGTQSIRDRLSANIEQLTRFFEKMRSCPATVAATQWNLQVVCSWDALPVPPESEVFAYEQALAIPSANYLPVPAQVARIIDTLRGDLFEPDPLVVKPGSP